jgi:hypothetical protein
MQLKDKYQPNWLEKTYEGTSAFHSFTIYIQIGSIANLYLLHEYPFFLWCYVLFFQNYFLLVNCTIQIYVMILFDLYIIFELFLKL